MKEGFKSGFVGIVGPTNSGKSTLMNALLGKKLSIVSARAQTTYHGIRGVETTADEQVIYVDTPGFQRHREPIARLLNRVAEKNAKDCDLLLWVFDATNPRVLAQIEQLKPRIQKKPQTKSLCLLNKIDKISKENLLPLLAAIAEKQLFAEIIPISAKNVDGVDRILPFLKPHLPEGHPWYAPDVLTDRSQDFVLSEFIREKIYRATREEVPYAVRIEIEPFLEAQAAKVPTFHAVIYVDSDSRRGILIGKQGAMLKHIGTAARKDIEAFLGKHICLKLHVRVQENWREDGRQVKQYLELDS